MPKKNENKEKQPQAEKFSKVARELGCDEDEAAFDEKLRKVSKPDPKGSIKKEEDH